MFGTDYCKVNQFYGEGNGTFGRIGRCPRIKDSARAGSRHSGVRLEVSVAILSVGG